MSTHNECFCEARFHSTVGSMSDYSSGQVSLEQTAAWPHNFHGD